MIVISSSDHQIGRILPSYISSLLEASNDQSKSNRDREIMKDAAIHLVIAISVKSQSRAYGISEIHSSIDPSNFFTSHLINEIQISDSFSVSNILVRSAVLKFISIFRNQFEKSLSFA